MIRIVITVIKTLIVVVMMRMITTNYFNYSNENNWHLMCTNMRRIDSIMGKWTLRSKVSVHQFSLTFQSENDQSLPQYRVGGKVLWTNECISLFHNSMRIALLPTPRKAATEQWNNEYIHTHFSHHENNFTFHTERDNGFEMQN